MKRRPVYFYVFVKFMFLFFYIYWWLVLFYLFIFLSPLLSCSPFNTGILHICFSKWSRLCSKLLAASLVSRETRCSYASHFTSVLREEKTKNSINCTTQEYCIEVRDCPNFCTGLQIEQCSDFGGCFFLLVILGVFYERRKQKTPIITQPRNIASR